jgi:hypothetical protein
MLLECLGTRNWRITFANYRWLNMNKEIALKKVLRYTNKDQIRTLGKYLDKVKCKWFNKTKELYKCILISNGDGLPK